MRSFYRWSLALAAGAGLFASLLAAAQEAAGPVAPGEEAQTPAVVASIKPVHALAAGVMAGLGEPGLIIEGADSPHSFTLRPSQAGMLAEADLVLWIGPELERFLERPLASLAAGAEALALIDAPGVTVLPYAGREDGVRGEAASSRPHDEAGHDGHDRDGHAHEHGGRDPHIWLDPQNAIAMTEAIAAALAGQDPANAGAYHANAARQIEALRALETAIEARLAPVAARPFITFHDAYRYFERRFDLAGAGAITVSPEAQPGARRLTEIRETIDRKGVVCVFAEPPFQPRLVATVIEGTGARAGMLDPEGVALPAGPEHYAALMMGLAEGFADCLSE